MQEGILILKGFKIIFINEIFQNLSIRNNLKPQIYEGDNDLSNSCLDQKIFYLYSMQEEKYDLEIDNQNSQEFKILEKHLNGT